MKLSPPALALAFLEIGLSSVGGAAATLRHVLVVKRRWIEENDFSELFGLSQALPGATASNVAIMFGDRFGGAAGSAAALAGLCIPSTAAALLLAAIAMRLSATNARFAAAESAVTAAVAGLLIGNGIRLAFRLWRDALLTPWAWRAARLGISIAAIVLVAGLHVWIPAALVLLVGVSLGVERSTR